MKRSSCSRSPNSHSSRNAVNLFLSILILTYPLRGSCSPTFSKTISCPEAARQVGLDAARAAVLCGDDGSNQTAELQCFVTLHRHLTVDATIALCGKNQEITDRCVSTLKREQFSGGEVERICRSATEEVFPERCVLDSKMWTSVDIKIARCRHSCNVTATDYCFEHWQGSNENQARAVCAFCLRSIPHVDAVVSCVKASRQASKAVRTFEARMELCKFVDRLDPERVLRCVKECPAPDDTSDTAIQAVEVACVGLCQRAASNAPGRCFDAIMDGVSDLEEEVERSRVAEVLCDQAVSLEPVLCYRSERLARKEAIVRARMCRFATNHRGRLDCLQYELSRLPIVIEGPTRAELCEKASSSFPSVCLDKVLQRLQLSQKELRNTTTVSALVSICSEMDTKAEVSLVERCLSRLGSQWLNAFETVSAVRSCAQLRNLIDVDKASHRDIDDLASVPAKCVDIASRRQGSSPSVNLLKLCSASLTTAPGECFSELTRRMKGDISTEAIANMCSVSFGRDSYATACCIQGLPARVSETVASLLCANVTESNCWSISSCYRDAPRHLSASDRISLCTGKGGHQAACAFAAGSKLASSVVTAICSSADSVGPGVCAARMFEARRFEEEDIVAACRGAADDSPARCMVTSQASRLPTNAALMLCHEVTNATLLHVCVKQLASTRLTDLEKAKLCGSASTLEAAVCAATKELSLAQSNIVLHICERTLNATATVACFNQLITGAEGLLPLQEVDASKLCAGTGSLLPARCYAELSRFGKPFALSICARVESGCQVRCAARAFKNGVRVYNLVQQLCISRTCEAAGLCIEQSPAELDETQTHALCANAEPRVEPKTLQQSTPVRCLKDYRLVQWEVDDRIRLCSGAKSLDPLKCVEEIQDSGVYVTSDAAAVLCNAARSAYPALCFVGLHSSAYLTKSEVVALCKQANSTGPAECASSAQFQLHSRLVLSLCKHAISDAPYQCMQDSPSSFPDFLKVWLCAQATSKFPSSCAGKVQAGLTNYDKVQLCRNAQSPAPAACADAVPNGLLSKSTLVRLCQNATDVTPAHCIAYIERIKGRARINSTDISFCKTAKAFPAAVDVMSSTRHHSKSLPALEDLLPITAVVVDQFGYPLAEELSNVSAVQVEVLNENPLSNPTLLRSSRSSFMQKARVQERKEFPRVPVDTEGEEEEEVCVEGCLKASRTPNMFLIENMTTIGFGSLWITVHIRRGDADWIEPAVIRFYRDMNYWDMISKLQECLRLPLSHMKSNVLHVDRSCSQMFPWKFTLQALARGCSSVLEDTMAVQVTTTIVGSSLCAIMKPGRAQLLLNIDTPTIEMNATKRLRLPWDYGPDELKKAYRTELSRWHPDKWVDSPAEVIKLATEKYIIIREAYELLTTAS